MKYSRRDLSLLLPILAAASGGAQNAALPSKTYSFGQLPVHTSGENQTRLVLDGETPPECGSNCMRRDCHRAARRIRRITMSTKRWSLSAREPWQ